jgi:hypothetical protein
VIGLLMSLPVGILCFVAVLLSSIETFKKYHGFPEGENLALFIVFETVFLGSMLLMFVVAATSGRVVFRPFDLRVDLRGIELNVAGRHISYPWKEINKVAIRRIGREDFGKRGICVYPLFGAPPPQRIMALNFPKLEKRTGWIVVAPDWHFKVPTDNIVTALARFAGSRWDPTD